uniref:Uncharacterized protein n=1 Tax=Plectus sambesii TaxID=2011161 RepID=A0A914VXH9_9BILA
SPGKDANYCPCPNREDSSYGKSPSTNPTSYGVGEGGNIATYNNINAGGSRGDSGANGFNSLSPYNRYTGSTFSPTGTRSTFLTYPPADPTPSTQLYSQPKDTIFGPGAPSGNPFNGGSSSSRESFPSAAFENEEQPRFAPQSGRASNTVAAGAKSNRAFVPLDSLSTSSSRFAPQSGRVSNTVAAGAKSNRAFVPLDSLSTSSSPSSSSSPKGEANIPASIFSDKAIHPAFPQKLPIIKPLSTSGPLYRVRTVDTTSKSAFGWQRTTPFITNARLHDDERIFSRYHPKQQA